MRSAHCCDRLLDRKTIEINSIGIVTAKDKAVALGVKNPKIGGQIGVSESSIKATLQQLFTKAGVRTRSQLVRIALESSQTARFHSKIEDDAR